MITTRTHTEEYLHNIPLTELNYLNSMAQQAIVLMELEPQSSQLRLILEGLRPVLEAMARDGMVYERPTKVIA
jgi:hypothetical protein